MGATRYFAGIDVGTTTTKAVIIDDRAGVMAAFVRRSGTDLSAAATTALEAALANAALTRDRIEKIVATGYGRRNVPFADETRTEISCHGLGCYHYFPEAITVVDIGGQDNKIIRLDSEGRRVGFKMNRKCAAGTGAFLEEISRKLDIPLEDINDLAERATESTRIGSYCTVFTATEVLDKIRTGEKVENIVRGLVDSVVKRILEMDTLHGRLIMTGGVVAHNPILAELLGDRAGITAEIAPHPQEMGAFGAALHGGESSVRQ